MKKQTLLQKLELAARQRKLEKHSKESITWFMRNAKRLGRENSQQLLLKQQPRAYGIGKDVAIGRMFSFAYDPLHKDTLPYFDRFPLGFYVGPAPDGFYMMNLHYLSPKYRAIIFDELLNITTNPGNTARKKVRLTYDLLNNSRKFRLFRPCFKHYLAKQLDSRIVNIPYDEWEAAIFLPIATFQGASAAQVWSDSILGL